MASAGLPWLLRHSLTDRDSASTERSNKRSTSSVDGAKRFLESVKSEIRQKDDNQIRQQRASQNDLDDFTLNKLNLKEVTLVGREREIKVLGEVYETGNVTPIPFLTLIKGHQGVGKTKLASQLRPIVTRKGGFFCEGRFEHTHDNAEPYTALRSALMDLAKQILKRKDSATIVEELRTAVENDHQIITNIVPSLNLLLTGHSSKARRASLGQVGSQSGNANVGTEAFQYKFKFLFRKFLRALESPLVMLLDDIHKADPCSLSLIEKLLRDPENIKLHLLTTCRDDEIKNDHPFIQMIVSLRDHSRVRIRAVSLHDLDVKCVAHICATVVRSTTEKVMPLAELVHSKTHGNPYFVLQCLQNFVDQKLLKFNFGTISWYWDEVGIKALATSDNVAGWLVSKIGKLPRTLLLTLQVCACLGDQFDNDILFEVMENVFLFTDQDPFDVESTLELLVEYGFLEQIGPSLSFVHNTIQTAALSISSSEEIRRLELQIGLHLLERSARPELEQDLFRAVDLCNMGSAYLSPQEKIDLAVHNSCAGELAMKKSSFSRAVAYFRTGLELLGGDQAWVKHYRTTLQLFTHVAEAEFSSGNFDEAEAHVEDILSHSQGKMDDQIRALQIRLMVYAAKNRCQDCIDLGLFLIKSLDKELDFPANPGPLAALSAVMKTNRVMKKQSSESVRNCPVLKDSNRLRALECVKYILIPTFTVRPLLLLVMTMKIIRWSLKHGISKYLCPHLLFYSNYLFFISNDLRKALIVGEVAVELAGLLRSRDVMAQNIVFYYGMHFHLINEMAKIADPAASGYQIGVESGQLSDANLNLFLHGQVLFETTSRPLSEMATTLESNISTMKLYGQDMPASFTMIFLRFIRYLLGQSDDMTLMKGASTEDDNLLASSLKSNASLQVTMDSHRMQLAYLFGDYMTAAQYRDASKEFGIRLMVSNIAFIRHLLFRGLTASSLAKMNVSRRQNVRDIRFVVRKMKAWYAAGNPNVKSPMRLLEAELAGLAGDKPEAELLYKQSIHSSARSGLLHYKAVAQSLNGEVFIESGDDYWASYNITNAIESFRDWGALRKATAMTEKYKNLDGVGGTRSSSLEPPPVSGEFT